MKTKQNQFIVGQLVKVKGYDRKFRYVSRNIVRDIDSGQCVSVCFSKIKAVRTEPIFDSFAKILVIAIAFIFFIFIIIDFILNSLKQ